MQQLCFFKLVFSLLPDAFFVFFSAPTSKTSDFLEALDQGFQKNMAAIKQQAIVEKELMKVIFPFFSPKFMCWLEFKAYGDDPNVLCDAK